MKQYILPLKNMTPKHYPNGTIYQSFGENQSDYAPLGYPGGHPGWDLPTFLGDKVLAVFDGVVFDVQDVPNQLGGRSIRLLCDDRGDGKRHIFAFSHLSKIFVKDGQRVRQGDVLGLEGNTGFIISGGTKYWGNAPAGKGVHLHFGCIEVTVTGQTPNILNYDNGFKGFIDPTPLFTDSIKADLPDPRIPLLQKIVELYRSLIRAKGQEPVA